jgi:hypothetical protein
MHWHESLRVYSPQLAAFFGNPIPRSLLRGRLLNRQKMSLNMGIPQSLIENLFILQCVE